MFSKRFWMFLFAGFGGGWGMLELQDWVSGNSPSLGTSLGWASLLVANGLALPIAFWCLRKSGEHLTYGIELLAPSLCLPVATGIMAQYGMTTLWPEPRSWPRLGIAVVVYLMGVVGYLAADQRRRSVRNRHLLQTIAGWDEKSRSLRCPVCGWDLKEHSLYALEAPCCDDCWILWRLRERLIQSTHLPPAAIVPGMTIPEGLELDLFELFGFLAFVELKFGVQIRSEDLRTLKTLADVIELIRERSYRIGFV